MPASTFGVISGLSAGWMAAGAGAIATVALIHLLARRRFPIAALPTVAFLSEAARDTRRRRRLRDLLLLILRAGAVAALALAFDRPVWLHAAPTLDDSKGVELVIILDASASMQRTERGESHFERARRRALDILNDLDQTRDRAGLILARRAPRDDLPTTTTNIDELSARLDRAQPTLERADLPAALAAAYQLDHPEGEPELPRRVILLTDRQRSQWEGASFPSPPESTETRVIALGASAPSANAAITALEAAAPTPGAATRTLTASLLATGADEQVRTLTINSPNARRALPIALSPGERRSESVDLEVDLGAETVIRARIEDDAFPFDDERAAVLPVQARPRVLLITDRAPPPAQSAQFFLRAALEAGRRFDVTAASPGDLPDLVDARPNVIAIASAAPLPPESRAALASHLERAAGLLWLLDSEQALADARSLAAALDDPASSFPILLEKNVNAPTFRLRRARLAPGPAELEKRWNWIGAVAGVSVVSTLDSHSAALDATTLLEFDDGAPALAIGEVGSARVALAAMDLSPSRSNIVAAPVFPVLVQELAIWLAGERRAAHPAVSVGETMRIPIPDDAALAGALVDAGGDPLPVRRAANGYIVETRAEAPGLFEVRTQQGRIVARRAVHLHPAESDMTPLSEREMQRALSTGALDPQASDTDAGQSSPADVGRDEGLELWPALVALALLLLTTESLLIGARSGRRAPLRLERAP